MFGWNRKCVTPSKHIGLQPSEGKLGNFLKSQNGEALAFSKSQHQESADDFLLPMTTNKVNFDSFSNIYKYLPDKNPDPLAAFSKNIECASSFISGPINEP